MIIYELFFSWNVILPCTVVQESENCAVSAGSVDGGPYMTWFLQILSTPTICQ